MGTWLKKHKYKLNHDIDNMDRILLGIIASNHPEPMKKKLIDAVAVKGQNKQAPSVICCVLELAGDWALNGETELVVSSGFKVFREWGQSNLSAAEAFLTRSYLVNMMSSKHRNNANVPILLHESMKLVRGTPTGTSHIQVIEAKAINYVQEHVDLECLHNFVVFLDDFRECIPKGDFGNKFSVSVLQNMSVATTPADGRKMLQFVKDTTKIAQFLNYVWTIRGGDCIMDSLRAIFTIIASPDKVEPCVCLGSVVRYIPLEMASSVVKNAISDPIIDDYSMTSAVQRMIDWLSWPTIKYVDQWVIMFLRELASAEKFTIIITVTDNKVEQVVEKLIFPSVREAAFNILWHMLLSCQHAPEPFHKILPLMPDIMRQLKDENCEKAQHYFIRTVELLHCLMQLHAGFPDLYDPIMEVVKGYPKPSSAAIHVILEEKRWCPKGVRSLSPTLKISERSDTGKTGLFNLGNTCYMNSVLQALFISDAFRQSVLGHVPLQSEHVMLKLQEVFAFLSCSLRPAYSPVEFLQVSRPRWFAPGCQHDCSEFMRHLLVKVHEEQLNTLRLQKKKKSTLSKTFGRKSKSKATVTELEVTSVQKIFGGNMCTTVQCLNCKNESSRDESFTDIPLAFPEYPSSPQISLAGGDCEARLNKDPIKEEQAIDSQTATNGVPGSCQVGLDLSDLIDYYLQPEKLSGDNKYDCEKCNGLQEGERRIKMTKAPETLILSLLRFSYDAKLQSRSKIFREVRYPKTIALPIDRSGEPDTDQQLTKRQRRLPANLEQKLVGAGRCEDMAIYGLSAVIVHSGTSSECGHYYCYGRHSLVKTVDEVCDEVDKGASDVDFLQEKWYLFNDSRVSSASYSSFSNLSRRFIKDTPYVLMYRRITLDSVASHGVDLSESITTVDIDPPIRHGLRMAVSKDNSAYEQEQKTAARAKQDKQDKQDRPNSGNSMDYYNNWDDKDKDPPDNCGGGSGGFGGFDTSGARFVF